MKTYWRRYHIRAIFKLQIIIGMLLYSHDYFVVIGISYFLIREELKALASILEFEKILKAIEKYNKDADKKAKTK